MHAEESSSPFIPPVPLPAPDGISGLGVLARLRRNALGAFPRRCLDEPVVRLRIPGRALFLVGQAASIYDVLQTKAADFRRMPAGRRILGPVVGDGLLTSEGETWRRQRKAMAPAFTPRALPTMAAHIVRATEPVCDALQRAATAPVDLYARMQVLSLEIAARSMFSIEADAFRDSMRAMIGGYTAGIGRPAPEDFVLPRWMPTPLTLRRTAFRRRWLALMREVVGRRRPPAGDAPSRDLFDLLATLHGPDESHLLIDQVATMIVAGHETTALTLFWALYLLAQAPDWQERVRAEAMRHDLAADRAGASLPTLDLTRAVVNETLRLYSPAFMTARDALRHTTVGGETVPSGSMLLMPFFLLHRDPRVWPEPDRFDPGRFLDATPARGHFLPFGVGPHVCIGAQLAMSEAVLALALLVRRFAVTLAPGNRPVIPVATLSTRPDHGPAFRLQPVAA